MEGGGWCLEPEGELAGLAEQSDLYLKELVGSVEDGEVLFAFGDAGVLLVSRGHLRATGWGGVELDEKGVELELGVLLVEGCDFGAGLEFEERVLEFGGAVAGLKLGVSRLLEGARGFGG